MTKIKICGLTRMEEISYVNEYQPEYVGFVCYSKSRRWVEDEWAERLKRALSREIQSVGVFVNEPVDHVVRLCDRGIIDLIQLHGHEDEAYIQEVRRKVEHPIIKAVRVKNQEDILKAQKLSCQYLLLDTYTEGQYGGSGQEFSLTLIPPLNKPCFLAGGLQAGNVAEKIRQVHPYGVDISSGVENIRGSKDPKKIKEFITKVRGAGRNDYEQDNR